MANPESEQSNPNRPREAPLPRAFFDGDFEGLPGGNGSALRIDSLDVSEQVESFAALITSRDARLPMSLGLFGNWGIGKSHFMELLVAAVGDYVKSDAKEDNGERVYVERVAQIRFNAWHFVDSNLWASLAAHVFGSLATELAGRTDASEIAEKRADIHGRLESSKEFLDAANERLKRLQSKRAATLQSLGTIEQGRAARRQAYDKERWKRLLASKVTLGDKGTPETVQDLLEKKVSGAASILGLDPTIKAGADVQRLAGEFLALHGATKQLFVAAYTRLSTPGGFLLTVLVGAAHRGVRP